MNKDLIASMVLGLSIFLFFILVIPQYDGLRGVNAALEEREQLLIERNAAIAKVKSLDSQIQGRQSDINKILVFLPDNKQIDQLLSSIEQASQQAGLQLISLSSSAPSTGVIGQYGRLFVSMDLEGFYPNIINFLTNLESNLRLYDINEINVAESSGDLSGVLTVKIDLNAYFLK